MYDIAVGALVVGGSAAVLILVLILTWFLDRSPREPISLVGFFFVWGLVAGGFSNRMTSFLEIVDGNSLVAWVNALWPFLIILAPLVVMAAGLRGFDCPSDGFVYGLAVALGFFSGRVASCMPEVLSGEKCGLSTVLIAVTAITLCGCVVGFSSMSRKRVSKYGLAAFGVLPALVVGISGLLAVASATRAGKEHIDLWTSGITAILLVLMVSLVYYTEHRIISGVVEEEVALKVLPDWTNDVFGFYRKRIRSYWWPLRHERTVISRIISRLAFRKRALSDLAHASGDVAWIEIVLLRKEIKRIFESGADEIDETGEA